MPRFNDSVEMKRFKQYQIPKTSTMAATGIRNGVYFFWRGQWRFMGIRGFYIDAPKGFDVANYCDMQSLKFFKKH